MNDQRSFGQFTDTVKPMHGDLKRYCLAKAGSDWEADDLLQETLVKAYRWHLRFPEREVTKPFLYRIAANAWIDICRTRKLNSQAVPYEEDRFDSYEEWNRIDVREALELLSDRLEPRQVVLILLIDVFDFTAKEAALLFNQTEGSIKAALHRARARLKTAADSYPERWDDGSQVTPRRGLSIEVFEAFVDGFRRLDPFAIIRSFQSMVDSGVKLESIKLSGNILYFAIRDPDGHPITITQMLSFVSEQYGSNQKPNE